MDINEAQLGWLMGCSEAPGGKEVSLGLDKEGHLYLNGKRIVTEQKLKLQWWMNAAIFAGAIGALAQGVVAVVTVCKDW